MNADRKTKLIRRATTPGERPHDSKQWLPVLVGNEKELFGDSGYLPNQKALEKLGIKKKTRGKQGQPAPELSLRDKYRNKLRAPVKHIFACWKTVFKVDRVGCRGLERVNQPGLSLQCKTLWVLMKGVVWLKQAN